MMWRSVLLFLIVAVVVKPQSPVVTPSTNLIISTYVGTGTEGSYGSTYDGGPASSALLKSPNYMAIDASGNLYLTDNHAIRYVDKTTGIISTVAGTIFVSGTTGDAGPANSALLNYPAGIAVDSSDDLYIADTSNNAIRLVTQSTQYMTTIAGTLGSSGSSGEGISALSAYLNGPTAVAIDPSGKVYIADTLNHVIRVVSNGIISTFAGTLGGVGTYGNTGDNSAATNALLHSPSGIAVSGAGKYVYIADTGNNRVRVVTVGATNIISNYAGQAAGAVGTTGDLGAATSALLTTPKQIFLDSSGNLYIADSINYVVRVVATSTHIISLVAGTYKACSTTPTAVPTLAPNGSPTTNSVAAVTGPATSRCFEWPQGVVVDNAGTVYISDTGKFVIAKAVMPNPTQQPTAQPTNYPSSRPSRQPTIQPSEQPSRQPTAQPSRQPTTQPSRQPTAQPTMQPSRLPTAQPSQQPTNQPTGRPSRIPTSQPSLQPFNHPSAKPSLQPFSCPSTQPTRQPTNAPSMPSSQPTNEPTHPTPVPTVVPTSPYPTASPNNQVFNRIQVFQSVAGVTPATLGTNTSDTYKSFVHAFQTTVAKQCGPTVKWSDVTITKILPSARRLTNEEKSWLWSNTSSSVSSPFSPLFSSSLRGGLSSQQRVLESKYVNHRNNERRALDATGVTVIYVVVSGSLTADQMSTAVTQAVASGAFTTQLQTAGFPSAVVSTTPTVVIIVVYASFSPTFLPTGTPVALLDTKVSVSVGAVVGGAIGAFFGLILLVVGSYIITKNIMARRAMYLEKVGQDDEGLTLIPWSHLEIAADPKQRGGGAAAATLGKGAFGVVVQAVWKGGGASGRRNTAGGSHGHLVAIKVTTRSMAENGSRDYESEIAKAKAEAMVIVRANRVADIKEDIVEVLGFAEGPLPPQLTAYFNVRENEPAFGIIMRLEAGGNMDAMLHKAHEDLSMTEKIRLLMLLCRGVEGLHFAGIVHGDLKPANILFSAKNPPDVRISDFGLAAMRAEAANDNMANGMSAIQTTNHGAGTPTYSAPEMLLATEGMAGVARASKRTDIYALGIIAHEVLSRKRPFDGLNYGQLVNTVAIQGQRPSVDLLPDSTAPSVRDLITRCWDKDRAKRPTATECWQIFAHEFEMLDNREFDIFFSHRWASKPFLSNLYKLLVNEGYRVWYDQNEMGFDLEKSMKEGIERSTVVLCCVDSIYQSRQNCMLEARHARQVLDMPDSADSGKKRLKAIVTVLTESNIFGWGNDELKLLLKVQTTMFVDLGELAHKPGWEPSPPPAIKPAPVITTPTPTPVDPSIKTPSPTSVSGTAVSTSTPALPTMDTLSSGNMAGGAGGSVKGVDTTGIDLGGMTVSAKNTASPAPPAAAKEEEVVVTELEEGHHGPPPELLEELQEQLKPLLKILHEVGCRPSNKQTQLTEETALSPVRRNYPGSPFPPKNAGKVAATN